MSMLAMSAASLEDVDHSTNKLNMSLLNQKKMNKTQRFRQGLTQGQGQSTQKVENMLELMNRNNKTFRKESLQNLHSYNNDDEDDLDLSNFVSAKHSDDFKPIDPYHFPQKPQSAALERIKSQQQQQQQQAGQQQKEGFSSTLPQPIDNDEYGNLNNLQQNYMTDAQATEYIKRMSSNVPNPNQPLSFNSTNSSNDVSSSFSKSVIDKLNFVINLLEENRDQRTENKTEEIILYSFLGIFVIFIVDSFAKIGRYVR